MIMVEKNGDIPCREGDLVEAELLPRRGYLGKTARVVDNLGPADSPGAFSALALAEFEIPHDFDDAVLAETDGMEVPPANGRPIFAIFLLSPSMVPMPAISMMQC